jgi:hypothetical protein
VVTAAGMLLQMRAGSTLYPSFAGPIVMHVAGLIAAVAGGVAMLLGSRAAVQRDA